MKILVFGDTHGNITNMINIINRHSNIDCIIHLGDNVKDALKVKSMFHNIPIKFIRGNCDFNEVTALDELIFEFSDKKVMITHGHRYGVKYGYENIYKYAISKEVDIVLFGHTHIPYLDFHSKLHVMNPGSTSGIRAPKCATFGLIEVDEDKKIHMTLAEIMA